MHRKAYDYVSTKAAVFVWLISMLVFSALLIGCSDIKQCDSPESSNSRNIEESFIHLSFDDVSYCIANLSSGKFESVWQEPFFKRLKELHGKYDAKFSLYVYLDGCTNICDGKYQDELGRAASWLKFGLHCDNGNASYKCVTYEEGKEDWQQFASWVYGMTGTIDSIDRIPRLHCFEGSKEALSAMRECENGAIGFLAADDERSSYYLTATENLATQRDEMVLNKGVFLRTDVRLENLVPSWFGFRISDAYTELAFRLDAGTLGLSNGCIVFTHEWLIYDGMNLTENVSWIEDTCKFAQDFNIVFSFPQECFRDDVM